MTENKINWGVRFKNKVWVSGFVSQTLLMLQAIFLGLESLQVIDIDIQSVDAWVAWLTGITNLILAYLAYLGLVVDPTVEGLGDSHKVLKRNEPLPKNKQDNFNL